jgi:hypothetical protein
VIPEKLEISPNRGGKRLLNSCLILVQLRND